MRESGSEHKSHYLSVRPEPARELEPICSSFSSATIVKSSNLIQVCLKGRLYAHFLHSSVFHLFPFFTSIFHNFFCIQFFQFFHRFNPQPSWNNFLYFVCYPTTRDCIRFSISGPILLAGSVYWAQPYYRVTSTFAKFDYEYSLWL